MPFLFVDYDQGAGGEFFCYNLSLEESCIPVEKKILTKEKRTKIEDVFGQEFLKYNPKIFFKKSHPTLYELIPAHRTTPLAKELNLNFKSIRISSPTDTEFIKFFNYQKCKKVFFSKLPNKLYYVGELENLSRVSKNKDWIKQASYEMDYLSLFMLSKGVELTEENKKIFLEGLLTIEDEPNFNYDLIIPYENLFINTDKIKKNILNIFNINIKNNWLDQYKKDYEEYNTQIRFNDSIFL